MKPSERSKFLLVIIFFAILVLAFLVIKPFIVSLMISMVLAFLLFPVYQWLFSKTKKKHLSAAIIAGVLVIILIVPTFFILNMAAREAIHGYTIIKQNIDSLVSECDQQESFACDIFGSFGDISSQYYLQKAVESLASIVVKGASSIALSLPQMIANFFLILFTTFYLLMDGERIVGYIKSILPYSLQEKERIMQEIYSVTHGILHGTFLLAIIEAIIAWIAFFIAGVPGSILWALLVFVFGFIPMIGPSIIWIPALLILIFQNKIWASIIVLVAGIMLAVIDNLLRPYIIGDKTKIHPVMVLLGMLGGIALFGFIGIVIGQLILSLAALLVEIFVEAKNAA